MRSGTRYLLIFFIFDIKLFSGTRYVHHYETSLFLRENIS